MLNARRYYLLATLKSEDKQSCICCIIIIETLRSTTATSTKMSPQNITLHYRKFLAVMPSRSRSTMWTKYSKNKLARAVSE